MTSLRLACLELPRHSDPMYYPEFADSVVDPALMRFAFKVETLAMCFIENAWKEKLIISSEDFSSKLEERLKEIGDSPLNKYQEEYLESFLTKKRKSDLFGIFIVGMESPRRLTLSTSEKISLIRKYPVLGVGDS